MRVKRNVRDNALRKNMGAGEDWAPPAASMVGLVWSGWSGLVWSGLVYTK